VNLWFCPAEYSWRGQGRVVKLVSNEILSSKEAIIPILNIFLFKREGRGRERWRERKRRKGKTERKKSKRKLEHSACILYRNEKNIFKC
jgi:hypothetical protein